MQGSYSYKEIWKISVPLIIGGMAQAIINVTDSAFLGRVSEVAMGASAIAGLFFVTLLMLGLGFGVGAQIVIARLEGEGKKDEVSSSTHQVLYFLIALSVFLIGFSYSAGEFLLSKFVRSPEVLQSCLDYLNIRSFGFLFGFILVGFRSFYAGIADTKVISYSTALMAGTNFILNYIFIFGHFGFPEMGIKGAAFASTCSEALAAFFIIYYSHRYYGKSTYRLLEFSKPDLKRFIGIFKISAPIMIQMFASITSWFIFFLIVEKMGERELAISNIVRNVYMVLMIPLIGFGSATNSLVSNTIGQGRVRDVIPLLKKIILLSFGVSLIVVVLNAAYPYSTVSLFTNIVDVQAGSVPVIYVISGSLMLFSVAFILLSGVSGTGNTLVTLSIEIVTILFYLIATYFMAVKWKLAIELVWSVEYVYFALMGSLAFLYLKYGGWRK